MFGMKLLSILPLGNPACDTQIAGKNLILPDLYANLRGGGNPGSAGANCSQLVAFNSLDVIKQLIINVLQIAIALAGVVAVGIVIYGGILYITSNGNSAQITKAKDTIVSWIVGLIIIIGAYAIVAFLANIFS
ncbi:MAG: hypothetical protein ACHQUB_01255 [Candidatus Saccharimonadia bacterium]